MTGRLPALLAAVETWRRTGVPRTPPAWPATTARRKAIDGIRRDATPDTKLATPTPTRHAAHRRSPSTSTSRRPFAADRRLPPPRAIAISWHEGPRAGIPGLTRQHHWHAARGHALARLGRLTAAPRAYRRAVELARTPAEIAHLIARAETYDTTG